VENEKCPLDICDGTGVIIYEDNTYSECPCRKAMHFQNYLDKALIPIKYKNKTFDEFDPKDQDQKEFLLNLKDYVNLWLEVKTQGIGISLISHQTRVGKSHLACAVANALIGKYQKSIEEDLVVFVNVTNWIDRWRAFHARFNRDVDDEFIDAAEKQKEIDHLCNLDTRMNNCELLILDDIGEVPGTPFVSSKLYSVVEYRTSNNKPILITTNHPWDVIKSKYGDDGVRIVDRLKEMSLNYTFTFDKPVPKKQKKKK